MTKNSAKLTVDLIIRSVSCPGVWLCSRGFVSLTVEMLGEKYNTDALPPLFPLLYNKNMTFKKTLQPVTSLFELHSCLTEERVYCELHQWPSKPFEGKARVLATYIGVLDNLLYLPQINASSKIDLLMKPSCIFPGIIAPKIEVVKKMELTGIPESNSLGRANSESTKPIRFKRGEELESDQKPRSDDCQEEYPKMQKSVCHSPRSPITTVETLNRAADDLSSRFRGYDSHGQYYIHHRNLQDTNDVENNSMIDLKGKLEDNSNPSNDSHEWMNCEICYSYNKLFENGEAPKKECKCFKLQLQNLDSANTKCKIMLSRQIQKKLNKIISCGAERRKNISYE